MGHVTLHSRVTSTASCYIPFHPQHQDATATTLHHVHRGPWMQRHDPRMQRHEGEARWGREHDNDKGGDGLSCLSPQKVCFFFVFTFYICTNTLPPLPSRFP